MLQSDKYDSVKTVPKKDQSGRYTPKYAQVLLVPNPQKLCIASQTVTKVKLLLPPYGDHFNLASCFLCELDKREIRIQ